MQALSRRCSHHQSRYPLPIVAAFARADRWRVVDGLSTRDGWSRQDILDMVCLLDQSEFIASTPFTQAGGPMVDEYCHRSPDGRMTLIRIFLDLEAEFVLVCILPWGHV